MPDWCARSGSAGITLLALLARGRDGQGPIAGSPGPLPRAARSAQPGGLAADPEEASIAVRTDLWARQRVAEPVPARARGTAALIRQQLEKEWRALTGSAGPARLERWLDLFEQVSGGWPTLLAARAELIERLGGTRDRSQALAASRRLTLAGEHAETPALRARALFALARLLTDHGLLEDAAECYRRLAEAPGRESPSWRQDRVPRPWKRSAPINDCLLRWSGSRRPGKAEPSAARKGRADCRCAPSFARPWTRAWAGRTWHWRRSSRTFGRRRPAATCVSCSIRRLPGCRPRPGTPAWSAGASHYR